MVILITGGAGYVGSVLTEQLLQRNDVSKVIVFDNLMYKQDGVFAFAHHPKFEFVWGDVRDYEKLEKYLAQADVVIPLAAIVGFPACERDRRLAQDVNANHVKFIARNHRWATKLIYPNTNSGYGVGKDDQRCTEETPLNPISVYGVTKCEAERWILDVGGISLRLATVFGTSYRFRKDLLVNDFVLKALTDKYVVLFESHFKRNYIHVRDVVRAFEHMIGSYAINKGKAFNVGLSSANLSKLELCQAIQKHVPNFVIKTDEFSKDMDKRNYIVSNDKIEKAGWAPAYDLDYGIKELIKGYGILINSNTKYTNL
jgi:nucleoside-diphosphate-sugar epimerase